MTRLGVRGSPLRQPAEAAISRILGRWIAPIYVGHYRLRMRILTMAAVLACAACASDASMPGTAADDAKGTTVSGAAGSAHQQETTIAKSASGRAVVAWIGTISGALTRIEYAVSEDAGSTWGPPFILPIPPQVEAMSDPIVTVDASGTFSLVALGDGPHMGVLVFQLAPGARSFGAPASVDELDATSHHLDKTQIVPTATGFLVTYSLLDNTGGGARAMAATSADGITWQRDTAAVNNPVFIAPCADGNAVTAVYMDNRAGGVWSISSSDGGVHWTSPVEFDAKGTSATFPACIRKGSEIWALYGLGVSGVAIAHSSDGGTHYDPFYTVSTGAAIYGQIGLRADGSIDLAYYLSSSAVPFGFVHSILSPGGATQNLEMLRQGMHLGTERYGTQGLADYVGIAPGLIAFTDNASGTSHIAVYKESP